ncbi:hypothetical protein CC86DRAFT_371256 [Ophiobolus disseminans]|uniref:Uncharacterized protein n=1 Tax=Ophiobolus disseminans TaxID=1469910 RepID=A0A6A6ZVT4_9PLEO|nr:hypothetical protein CC86DRAFT_371256 [Ophiobolus disseminans]
MTESNEFLRGWTKLSEELKLSILRYVVPSGELLTYIQFHQTYRDDRVKRRRPKLGTPTKWFIFEYEVFPLLACSLISRLVYEAFYTQNTIHIGNPKVLSRPLSVQSFVRHVGLDLDPNLEALEILASLASSGFGFANLHLVEIQLQSSGSWDPSFKTDVIEAVMEIAPIRIKARKLIIDNQPERFQRYLRVIRNLPHTAIEECIMAKITVLAQGNRPITERWERYTFDVKTRDTPLQYFEAWPLEAVKDNLGRVTRKVVEL